MNYSDFIQSDLFSILKEKKITTLEFVKFVNSLIGINGFVKHHPKPILDYYYSLYPYSLTDIFSKLNIQLPQRKSISEGYKEDICNNTNDIKNIGISQIKNNLKLAAKATQLTSIEIIQNEDLWEKFICINSYHEKHSSDDTDYFIEYKTGWGYLIENKNITLDMSLIHFFRTKNITLLKECASLSVCGHYGELYDKETINALIAFKNHPISKEIISFIINDPLTWEGIFYDENFCNHSILEYIHSIIPHLNKEIFIS